MTPMPLPEFAQKISDIMREIGRGFTKRQKNELFKGELTLPQFLILDIIHKEGMIRMTDIAAAIDVSTAAATGMVDRMVKRGYLARVFDPADRRLIRIKLTSKGSQVAERLEQQRKEKIIEIFGQISELERNDYLRILTKVRDIITRKKD